MHIRLSCLGVVAALGVVSCSSEPPPPTFSDIHFAEGRPIQLDVNGVDIVSQFEPTFRPPEVEQDFPVPPQRAIENWVHDRLAAANPDSQYRARITIVDASAREPEGSDRCEVRAAVRVDIVDAHGFAVRSAHAEATRVKTIDADTSPDDRDLAWYGMTRDLTRSLTGEIERQIRSTFYPYVT